jgi:pyruvate kinase
MQIQTRKAKIVCTIGPACNSYSTLKTLAEYGMNVARLNFSHGTHDSHAAALKTIRSVEKKIGTPIAVMLDTKGPEIRTGLLKKHVTVQLKEGSDFILRFTHEDGDISGVYIDHETLAKEVHAGQYIYIDDGAIQLQVGDISDTGIRCRVITGGELGERKGVNIPGANLSVPTLTEKDTEDLVWAVKHDVDFVAVSFVRSADDIKKVRRVMDDNNGSSIKIIAKIETKQSVDDLEEILTESDGLMIARGDLGVEINTEDVPLVQKHIIEKCRRCGKPVIVATQMLDSMIRNPRPTRAEASDVANAIFDGTDAVMLSGETAGGKYPIEAIKIMDKIVCRAERESFEWQKTITTVELNNAADAVSHAAKIASESLDASAILSITMSGSTARAVSKYRPDCPIIAATSLITTWRGLSIVWGVQPVMAELTNELESSLKSALTVLVGKQMLKKNDVVVITAGMPIGVKGSTNMLYIHKIGSRVIGGQKA